MVEYENTVDPEFRLSADADSQVFFFRVETCVCACIASVCVFIGMYDSCSIDIQTDRQTEVHASG